MSQLRPARGRARTAAVTTALVAALFSAPFVNSATSSAAEPADGPSAAAPLPVSAADTADRKLLSVDFDAVRDTLVAGEPFPVSGTVHQVTRASIGKVGLGVPGTFTLAVTDATGQTLATQRVTAAPDGSFETTVPADATAGLAGDLDTSIALRALDATADDGFASEDAGATAAVLRGKASGLRITNSFVSSVGWVKPGKSYPSRILVTNPSKKTIRHAKVSVSAPRGSRFLKATGPGRHSVKTSTVTWKLGAVKSKRTATLVLVSRASSLKQLPTVVYRNLSSRAVLKAHGRSKTSTSHGPRVIPPSSVYDTARYGDRPFPVIPVQYSDRDYQANHSGAQLAKVINSPKKRGSTFNLYQEMSLKQLYPEGDIPSAGVATAGFKYKPGFDFQKTDPTKANTCTGTTLSDLPTDTTGSPVYPERITDGVYNLPGQTQWYGADANGSAVVGALGGVAALQQIDSGCGNSGRIVADAVALSDPEVDYSDFDTDKDGVVDFFMVVYAGCGGNGASQLGVCADGASNAAPYDNIWPNSSSLEYYLTDPKTGLPGYTTDDQLKNLEGKKLYYTNKSYQKTTTRKTPYKVFVRVGPYNLNPETAIDKASVISHEYGHSLGLPDFYSLGGRETYGDWNLMATDKSQNMDAYSRQELGWVVPQVLTKGTHTYRKITDSKQDIGRVTWKTPQGKSYTLKRGRDGIVHNSRMFVAKLPGRTLLDKSLFDTGEKASKTHAWFSGSGNDFGCNTDGGGRNLDFSIPALAKLPAGTDVKVSFKSNWDIEWDYDYGYVLTSKDGGDTYESHASEKGYTTSNTDPTAGNPNQNGCQASYDNGITGTSGSYAAGTQALDRKAGNTPKAVFLSDSYDISDLAGAKTPVLRFSYATDPGLARPGWFMDDIKVTANGKTIYRSNFEKSGSPSDSHVFNGGCKADNPGSNCTLGWQYVKAGAEADFDHAYYLEMRDRSGFDLNGNGQIDRDPIGWTPGLYLSYTDEAHGYGNAGTDDPPAQSPLDATPTPGSATPNLNDAAFTAAKQRNKFSDFGIGHTDNYTDPQNTSTDKRYPDVANPWRFQYDCLKFSVLRLKGQQVGPSRSNGDLSGDVKFRIGKGCGAYNYGYGSKKKGRNHKPVARFKASDETVGAGTRVRFDAATSTDRDTPRNLNYTWSFDNGAPTKDASGVKTAHTFGQPGTYRVVMRVDDPSGAFSVTHRTITVS